MGTLAEKADVSGEVGIDARTKTTDLAERRDKIIENFQTYFRVTYDELHAASTEETEELRTGLAHINLTEEDIAGWESFWEVRAQAMMQSAQKLYHNELMDRLFEAYNQQPRAVSMRIIKELSDKFKDPNVNYKQKENYVQKKLPGYITEWKKVARERREVLKDPQLKTLTSRDVQNVGAFLDEEQFLNLKYPKRLALLQEVRAILSARKKGPDMERSHKAVRKKLESLAGGANSIMAPSKVSKWMDRIFSHFDTPEEVEEFLNGTFEAFYVRNWTKVRLQFDANEQAMKKWGTPRGFPDVDLDTFLEWPYEKREAHVEEGRWRLQEGKEQHTSLKNLKMRIRHFLYTEDWEGAEETIEEAKSLDPQDLELISLESYLRHHKPSDAEVLKMVPNPQKTLDDMRTMLKQIPEPYQTMYRAALEDNDLKILSRLMQLTYNLIWVKEHGHWTEEKGVVDSESQFHREQTKERMKDGHQRMLEVNIIEGETEDTAAVRQQNTSPQIVYMGDSQGAARTMYESVRNRRDDEMYGYWTTLKAKNISYDKQREIVKNFHYPLKSGLRTLLKQNVRFTSHGPAEYHEAA